jgi:hypothetical protein
MNVLKNDFGEFDEEMFQGVKMPCVHIFCMLHIEKIEMDDVTLVMF